MALLLWVKVVCGKLYFNAKSRAFHDSTSVAGAARAVELNVSRSTGRPVAIGFANSGKRLVCVYEWFDEDTIIPITAYEVEE